MKALFISVVILVVFASGSSGMADEMPDSIRQALNDKLIGAWDLEYSRDGEKTSGVYTASWSPGGNSVRIEMSSTGDEGTTHASELMGWDAKSKSLTVRGFGAESNSWTIHFTDFSSSKWKGSWEGYFDGKIDGSPCTMELKGDSFEYRDTTDGKPLVITATRRQPNEARLAWWNFLAGDWSYVIEPFNEKGTVTWRMAAKKSALVGRFVSDNGVIGQELAGWQADQQRELVNGYSSDGGYWSIEITKQTEDEFEGYNYGILPDGKPFSGQFVGKKVDADHYQWTLTGQDGDGNPLQMTGKYERKKED